MKTPRAASRPPSGPGGALRAIREEKQLTLAALSTLTGFPVSTLSKIENGKIALSYDKLVRFSDALQVDITRLFSPNLKPIVSRSRSRRSVTRSGEGERIDTKNYDHVYPASDLLSKQFIPIIAELRAHSLEEFGELISHDGEEFTMVLDGALDLYTDTYAPLRLNQGDSIYFDSSMGHAYVAAVEGVCRVLTICSRIDAKLSVDLGQREKPAI